MGDLRSIYNREALRLFGCQLVGLKNGFSAAYASATSISASKE